MNLKVPGGSKLTNRYVAMWYRIAVIILAIVVILVNKSQQQFIFPLSTFLIWLSFHTLIITLINFYWRMPNDALKYTVIIYDTAASLAVVILTGSLTSPFLLYAVAPALTAALLLDKWIPLVLAVLTFISLPVSHLLNPFFDTPLTDLSLARFIFVSVCLCLACVLPFMVNTRLRHRIEVEDFLRERHRLSRELHDGMVQTLDAMRWKIQLLRRRLDNTGVSAPELAELERMALEAQRDARKAINLLRADSVPDNIAVQLHNCLDKLKGEENLDFSLKVDAPDLHLTSVVQMELLQIFQEALNNIRKHSGATAVNVELKRKSGHLEISIYDNGRGFAAATSDAVGSKGFGLSVMKERANSIGGNLEVTSQPGLGTRVEIEVPLDR